MNFARMRASTWKSSHPRPFLMTISHRLAALKYRVFSAL